MDDGSRHPCQDDEQNKPLTTPSFQQGLLESSDQGWKVSNITAITPITIALPGRWILASLLG